MKPLNPRTPTLPSSSPVGAKHIAPNPQKYPSTFHLVHTGTGESREVLTVAAWPKRQLSVQWGIAGIYIFDLACDRLRKYNSFNQRVGDVLPWRATEIHHVEALWNQLMEKTLTRRGPLASKKFPSKTPA